MAESNPTQVILTDDGIKIIKAQNTADNAASGIKNINDPNYLSPFEKPQLQVQMDNFTTIYAADKDIAMSEGVDFTAYDTAYHAYLAYMTPLIADMTTYSPIVRATFNSMVTAVQVEQKRFNTATQAQYNQQIKQAQTDIDDGQTKYKALQAEAKIMKSSVAGISDAADRAISSAGFASNVASTASQAASKASQAASSAVASAMSAESNASSAVSTANSTASGFGKVSQKADSAVASALSAESAASAAVIQASSATSDSKDAKQIAGAVNQSYKTLTDGSTMTIAELEGGLAVKLTKKDLDGYATETWAQNQIKMTADGINGTISSVKNTVDDHTTSIHDIQSDSKEFKTQFTTYKDTVDRHDRDISTIQADAKHLSSNFDSLNTDINGKLTTLQGSFDASSKKLSNTMSKINNIQVGGTNLLCNTDFNPFKIPWSYATSVSSMEGNAEVPIGAPSSNKTILIRSKVALEGNGSKDSGKGLLYSAPNVKAGIVYTFSAWVRASISEPSSKWVAESYGKCFYFDIMPGKWQRVSGQITFRLDKRALFIYQATTGTARLLYISSPKLEQGNRATDWSPAPEDNATVTALTQVKQTADGAQVLATNNHGDIAKLQVTAHGLQSTVSDKVSSDQLTQLSGQLTNKIKDLSSSTSSQFTQTFKDINGLVKKGDVVNQFNLDAGGALLSTSGNSTKIVFSSPNIIFDSVNPVQIPNANIPGTLTGKTIEFGTITATTKIRGADIEAPIIHSPSGSFKLDGNTGDIIGASIHSADNSWGIDKNGNINGATINAPTLDLGSNGTLTTDFNINQDTSLYGPKKGTGTLTIKTGVINSSSDNMSRYSNTKHYWYGFDDHGNVVKNGTNHTGDDYAPGYEKHDIMNSKGNVINRSYLDAMGLMFSEGGNSTYNTMLTGVGLETATALLHKDLATEGTFKAALGTHNKYGFRIESKVIAPMIRANSYTYGANMFISSYGTMGLATSTKANKLDIVDVPDMLQKGYNLLTLNPRQWFDKTSVEAYADVQSGNSDSAESVVDIKPVSGMVAEEVASAGLDDYVIKDENNKVQGLAYDRLWTLLLPVLRDMNDKINKLQKKEGI